MVITFPRDKTTSLWLAGLSFVLEGMYEVSPLRSGSQIAKDLGPNLWHARYDSAPLDEERFGDVRAWAATLMSVEAFLGYDELREYPILYRNGWGDIQVGGQPFDGTAQLDDVADNKAEIDLSQLPDGFGLRAGDFLSFLYGADDSRALHMVVAGGDASASGELTVEVRPHVRVGWSAGTTADLHQASAEMLIVPGSYSESFSSDGTGRISFEAVQRL